ncbi:MAG: radical SAM protein [Candidatus Methanoperedens sp.]|nr:radical SAM protein [Candidatus Methanoperedens sp.]
MHYDQHPAMNIIDALEIDSGTRASMHRAFARRLELFGNDICFFSEPFTPVSLTGSRCSLRCWHCNSHYLRHMLDGSLGNLYPLACNLAAKGSKGILLSGGSVPDGSVPTYRFSEIIQKIKKDTGLTISAHTGIVNSLQARMLSDFLDMALVDVIGDNDTIHDILGFDVRVEDYERTLRELSSAGIPLAPHIITGLHKGQLRGEFKALEIIKKFNPEVIVIVVFIPTERTLSEGTPPPDISDVVRVITKAREMFDVSVSLSCVRPGGRYRSILDMYAILSGVDRVAVPSRKAYETSMRLGLEIKEIPKMCCSYK